MPDYEVIIIGAGISGMVAAYTILNKEPTIDLIILEAKDRIGGRTLSTHVEVRGHKQCSFDIGAQWVSSSQKHLLNLINALELTIVHQQLTGITLGQTGKGKTEAYVTHPFIGSTYSKYELRKFFLNLEERSEKFQLVNMTNKFNYDFLDSMTMENYICTNLWTETAQNIARNMIRTICGILELKSGTLLPLEQCFQLSLNSITGVEPSQISALYYLVLCNSTFGFSNQYLKYDGGAKESWIKEGAQEICNQLQNRIGALNVMLNDPVIHIDQSRATFITVTTKSGKKYMCSAIINAAPPAEILKIKFTPPLTRLRRYVLEGFNSGHVTKFVITYKKAFWRDHGCAGEILSWNDGVINICYDVTKGGNPAIAGYIKEPSIFERNINGTFRDQVVHHLVRHWGALASKPIDYAEKAWWDEEFVGGCPMACPGIGTIKWYHMLSQPIGRMFWAGTENATQWNGYMNGAVQSGYRAAINCLLDIRPQSITYTDIRYIESKRFHRIRFEGPDYVNKYTLSIAIVAGYFLYRYLKKKFLT